MTVIRKAQEFFEGELSRLLKRPLARRETYALGDPVTPASIGVTTTKNTAIVATYDGIGHVICYDRQVLGTWLAPTLAVMPPMAITHANPKTTLDLWQDFDRRFQLGIKPTELVDSAIDITAGAITFTLNNLNPWFTGSVTIPIVKMYRDEEEVIYDFDWNPAPFEMATSDATTFYGITQAQYDSRIDATMLTYGIDYSAQSAALSAIPAFTSFDTWTNIPSANATALAAALKAVDGIAWINGAAGTNYNVANGGVVYNGPTESFRGAMNNLSVHYHPDSFMNMDYTALDNVVNKDYAKVLIHIINVGYGSVNLRGAVVAHYGGKIRDWNGLTDTLPAPLHNWPMAEDGRNLGTDGTAMDVTGWDKRMWPNYEQVMGVPLATSVLPLGAPLDVSGNFTLSFRLWRGSNEAAATVSLFGNGTTQGVSSVVYAGGGYLYLGGSSTTWEGQAFAARVRGGGFHTITIVREGDVIYVYKDGLLGAIHTAPATRPITSFTHFGKGANNAQPLDAIGDIMFWPTALNAKQVRKIKPNPRQLARV